MKIFLRKSKFTEKDKKKFENYLERNNLSKATRESYLRAIAYFFNNGYYLNIKEFERFKNDQINKGIKPASYNLRTRALNKYLEFKKVKYRIEPLKVQNQNFVEKELTEKDLDKMIQGLLKDRNYRWYSIFKLLAGTGCRISEFAQFTIDDVRRGYKDILGKGDKVRRVWIPTKIQKEVLKVYNIEGLFIKGDFTNVRRSMKEIAKRYGVDPGLVHPHEFRHFFAKRYYDKTHDIQKLKELLGHASINTTTRYLKTTSEKIEKEISSIVDW